AGAMTGAEALSMRDVFLANGWTPVTAVCVMLFTLMHWPCAAALWTAYRETGSLRWTAAAFFLPTVFGTASCLIVASAARLAGLM
ncbi:MAG: ferrous iron transporter B, partial [Oscillospiraceae bacterium]|nr:ferrous iron transporter B [Oscillospiraceae bacterium]